MTSTRIEWADRVWNPITGCTKVSPGCTNCYAERMSARLRAMGNPDYQDSVDDKGRWTGKITQTYFEKFYAPASWKKASRIFVNSMSDLFHPKVPDSVIADVMDVIGHSYCSHHTFLVLTKRPQRMLDFFDNNPNPVIPNLWLGVSVEDQQRANERIPLLLQTPAAVRFISAEPLLGPIDLDGELENDLHALGCGDIHCTCGDRGLDWVICGGESGPKARPMHPGWARSLRDQCKEAGVPFLFKQWGEYIPIDQDGVSKLITSSSEQVWIGDNYDTPVWRIGKKKSGRLLDGVLWDQYPERK